MKHSSGAVSFLAMLLLMASGCSPGVLPLSMVPLPIPLTYYNCIEVQPQALVDAYYALYVDVNETRRLYENAVFVFKDIELTEPMRAPADEGYIWAGTALIKCFCVNIRDVGRYRVGDSIDIVGVNKGPVNSSGPVILADCYILPAGLLQLPAGDSDRFISGY